MLKLGMAGIIYRNGGLTMRRRGDRSGEAEGPGPGAAISLRQMWRPMARVMSMSSCLPLIAP